MPVWLTTPGPVLLKRHVRASKYDPLIEEADLIEANPNYAHVKLKSGVEKTVSLRDLAPSGETLTAKTPILCIKKSPMDMDHVLQRHTGSDSSPPDNSEVTLPDNGLDEDISTSNVENYVTRFGRESKPVDRFSY